MMSTIRSMHTVYVAGPVLRTAPLQIESTELERLYDKLTNAARRAKAQLRLPIYEPALDGLAPEPFVQEIRRRIETADSVLAVIAASSSGRRPRLSVAREAEWAVKAGKLVVIVGAGTFLLPPRLPGLYYFKVDSFDTLDAAPVFRTLMMPR